MLAGGVETGFGAAGGVLAPLAGRGGPGSGGKGGKPGAAPPFPPMGSVPDLRLKCRILFKCRTGGFHIRRRLPLQNLRPIPVPPDVARSSGQSVVPLGEGLLQPLHNLRQIHPVLRLNVEPKLVGAKIKAPNLESKAESGFLKNPGKESGGLWQAEDALPVVDFGANFIPNALSEFSFLPHAPYTVTERHFALVAVTKISKKRGAETRRLNFLRVKLGGTPAVFAGRHFEKATG